MNTRSLSKTAAIIPETSEVSDTDTTTQSTDALVFDKAESVERLREKLAEVDARISTARNVLVKPGNEQAAQAATKEVADLEDRRNRIQSLVGRKEAKILDYWILSPAGTCSC